MTEAGEMAERINAHLPDMKAGSLCFWGEWFGKPYDNFHRIESCTTEGSILKVNFNEHETLSIWSPRGLNADQSTFRIADAVKVRWEWFYYGRPKTDNNRYFIEFIKDGSAMAATTNVDWYTQNLQGNPKVPAVEMF